MDENETVEILTFDELLEDDYYKAEFDKRLSQELDKISQSGVKGAKNMGNQQTTTEGEKTVTAGQTGEPVDDGDAKSPSPGKTNGDNPDPKNTQGAEPAGEQTTATDEPAKEMTAEQFELYNETLRAVSKTAHAGLQAGYNAFEDVEVKRAVREAILSGETPDAVKVAQDVITRLTTPAKDTKPAADPPQSNDKIKVLEAELALVKAGIVPERIEAALKLFLAEGGDPAKIDEFVKQYPEWTGTTKSGVTFSLAPPAGKKTGAASGNPPILTDFERRVNAAREARNLPKFK